MKKLNCFRGQFDFAPGRFVYQDGGPPEGPVEQGEKREAPAKTPDDARREEQKAEVRERYGDDNIEMVSEKRAREVLADPAKLKQFLAKFKRPGRGKEIDTKPNERTMNAVKQMLDTVKHDTAFLKKIIAIYADKIDEEYGYACNNAIKRLNIVDDKFFKEIVDKADADPLRTKALRKIQDENYRLSKILEWFKLSSERKQTMLSTYWYSARDSITSLSNPDNVQKVIDALKGDDYKAKIPRELAQKHLEELKKK